VSAEVNKSYGFGVERHMSTVYVDRPERAFHAASLYGFALRQALDDAWADHKKRVEAGKRSWATRAAITKATETPEEK
jgi:hypothetical protein